MTTYHQQMQAIFSAIQTQYPAIKEEASPT